MVNGQFSITGAIDTQGCDCGPVSGGVGMFRLCLENFVHGCDIGELQ